jgi:hypothetical protein
LSAISELSTSLAKYSSLSLRVIKVFSIFLRLFSLNVFLALPLTNSADASIKSVLLSFLLFLSTNIQVAIEVPKNKSDGS